MQFPLGFRDETRVVDFFKGADFMRSGTTSENGMTFWKKRKGKTGPIEAGIMPQVWKRIEMGTGKSLVWIIYAW